jgi:hypothetical protein
MVGRYLGSRGVDQRLLQERRNEYGAASNRQTLKLGSSVTH